MTCVIALTACNSAPPVEEDDYEKISLQEEVSRLKEEVTSLQQSNTETDLKEQSKGTEVMTEAVTEVSETSLTTEESTVSDTKVVLAEELSKELYDNLNSLYDDLTLYSDLLYASAVDTEYTLDLFCSAYPIPYEYAKEWTDNFLDEYRTEMGKDYFEYDSPYATPTAEDMRKMTEMRVMKYESSYMISDYLASIDWKKNVVEKLDSSKDLIQKINAIKSDEMYIGTIIEYYTSLSSYYDLIYNSNITYKNFFDKKSEIDLAVSGYKAELDIYLS